MSRKKKHLLGSVKLAIKKVIGFVIVILILAFIGYHLYSVASLAKNFKKSTGINSAQTTNNN